jgi:L-amino acid N-acyltransferase YncA/predicted O-methyltransferase YrrM
MSVARLLEKIWPRLQTAATDLTIRDATEADLPAIIDIYNAAIATRIATAQIESVTIEDCRDWLRQHPPDQYPFWVAEIDGQVGGWLSFKSFLPRCAYRGTAELSVYVDEKFRRRGIARKLLEEAILRAPALGVTAMVGLIFGHNEASLALFERLGFRRWGFLPAVAQVEGTERNLAIVGRHCPARPAEQENAFRASQFETSLGLMRALMQYRQAPIHWQMITIRDKYSMLHLDVLLLIYHFAKVCHGAILEVGAFVGASTIAATWGVRDSGQVKKLISVEPGGAVAHERLGTKDIWRDLERNLKKEGVSDRVMLIKGASGNPATTSVVHEKLGPEQIGLLILDADGEVKRDIDCYRDRLMDGCWMIIDDYAGPGSNVKMPATKAGVDGLVAIGSLQPLGLYGWSTWVGQWRKSD